VDVPKSACGVCIATCGGVVYAMHMVYGESFEEGGKKKRYRVGGPIFIYWWT
jgi:hypothetical protein